MVFDAVLDQVIVNFHQHTHYGLQSLPAEEPLLQSLTNAVEPRTMNSLDNRRVKSSLKLLQLRSREPVRSM